MVCSVKREREVLRAMIKIEIVIIKQKKRRKYSDDNGEERGKSHRIYPSVASRVCDSVASRVRGVDSVGSRVGDGDSVGSRVLIVLGLGLVVVGKKKIQTWRFA